MVRSGLRFSSTDWGVFLIALILVIIGLVMVYSASYGFSLFENSPYSNDPTFFVRRQVIYALAGLAALLVTWRIDYRWYRRFAVEILLLTVLVLFVMAVMGQFAANNQENAMRWLRTEKRSIQPVELAKIGALVYIAVWLEAKSKDISNRAFHGIRIGLVPFSVLLGIMGGLIVAQPDFSTAALLAITAAAMFFVAGADVKQLLVGAVAGGATLVAVAIFAAYRWGRIESWLDPFAHSLDKGYQMIQTLIALNRGGFLGVGLGQSHQKFLIYAPHTDGMYAIITEELGYVGGLIVAAIYGLWTWRGFRVARYAQDTFGTLLATGIVLWITFQAALHIGVITATTPFTGTVLPFVSYGGSSLVSGLASVGILLSISRCSRQPGGPEPA